MKISVSKLRKMKQDGQKIVMLTAYDAPTAHIAAECGIDLLLNLFARTATPHIHHGESVARQEFRQNVSVDVVDDRIHGRQ